MRPSRRPAFRNLDMTSILTNTAALSALQTLRALNSRMGETQTQVSSGLRIQTAADNAAYWSISTTMRSDVKAIGAVADALGLGSAKLDTAYFGIQSVSDVLSEFKAKLVAAKEPGVDRTKIQTELEQLKAQIETIASAASFNGVNWLRSDIPDITDSDQSRVTLVSSLSRTAEGISLGTSEFSLSKVALFNSTGGGLLEADARRLKTLGGIRWAQPGMDMHGVYQSYPDNDRIGNTGQFTFTFTGPVTFAAGDTLSFDVTVDADNPADVDAPHNPGKMTSILITRALIDSVLPGANGTISTFQQYADVLNQALSGQNADASARLTYDYNGNVIPNRINLTTRESSGLDGSSIEISNVVGPAAGLSPTPAQYGPRSSAMTLSFVPFEVFKDGDEPRGVEVDFFFSVNGAPSTHHSFDRQTVNDLLGKTTGKVETDDEMVLLLQSMISADWPDVIIEKTAADTISVRSDKAVDRLGGAKTSIGFTGITVSIEPIAEDNLRDIDIVANPQMLDRNIAYVEVVSSNVIDAAAQLGALKMRVDKQQSFTQTLMDSLDSGIGRLVDVDMNEASVRLKALQTQEQLAIQALQIANSDASNIMQLFR